tara:strand:- start:2230 stop:3660 length:1431 start_codon:yes stop_codon:yes gene_type:complete
MILTFKNLILKENIKLIPWLIIILSIGTQPSDFELITSSKSSAFNAARLFIALITSLIIIIFFFKDLVKYFFKKKNKILIDKNYLIFYLFLTFLLTQIIGYFWNFNDLINSNYADNIYLIILSFGFVAYFFLIKKTISTEMLKFFLYCLYFLICLSGIVFTIVHISKSSLESANYFSLYNSVLAEHQFFLNHELPRVTGISRTLSILNIILISLYFFNLKNKIRNFLIPIIFVLSIIIFAFQSRGTIICFTSSLIFFVFLLHKQNLKEKILILFFSILFPYISYEGIRYVQFEYIKSEKNFSIFHPFKSDTEEITIPFDKQKIENIIIDKNRLLDFTSSGRIELWKEGLKQFDKNKIFGYGPQADRYLLKENLKKFTTNNVSNGYLYSLFSGGYFGFFTFIIIIINLIYFLYKSIFLKKIFNSKNFIKEKLSLTIFFYFLLRLNIENSFAVFGIDFIIMFTAIGLFLLKDSNYKKI